MKRNIILKSLALMACLLCSLSAAAAEAYACYTSSNTTLTFYYDDQRASRTGQTYDLNSGMNDPGWYTDGTNASVTKVVFNSSFGSVRPTSTYEWFYDMNKLQTITGISYLKTDEVTNMGYMFRGCTKLTSIDVSSFNTSKVINMLGMFSDCSNLTTIYAGEGWSMATVSVNSNMFTNCTKLVGGKGTTYNPAYTNGYYARIDGGPSNPGYFTDKNESQPGDVNGDGFVNVADVTALINIILNR